MAKVKINLPPTTSFSTKVLIELVPALGLLFVLAYLSFFTPDVSAELAITAGTTLVFLARDGAYLIANTSPARRGRVFFVITSSLALGAALYNACRNSADNKLLPWLFSLLAYAWVSAFNLYV
jgi:hypothetical protein